MQDCYGQQRENAQSYRLFFLALANTTPYLDPTTRMSIPDNFVVDDHWLRVSVGEGATLLAHLTEEATRLCGHDEIGPAGRSLRLKIRQAAQAFAVAHKFTSVEIIACPSYGPGWIVDAFDLTSDCHV